MKLPLLLLALVAFPLISLATTNSKEDRIRSRLEDKLVDIESLIAQRDALDTTVSQAPVAWHLDHSLKVINNIFTALSDSDPDQRKSNFNFTRSVVFISGTIPRGVAQSPKSVRPPEVILTEDIRTQISQVRSNLQAFSTLPERANFEHPVFGNLNRKKTLRFLEIHTEHHLKIIRDILGE
ncbi:MAG: DUF1569 domain-containing protein [Bacteroidota bacterium]